MAKRVLVRKWYTFHMPEIWLQFPIPLKTKSKTELEERSRWLTQFPSVPCFSSNTEHTQAHTETPTTTTTQALKLVSVWLAPTWTFIRLNLGMYTAIIQFKFKKYAKYKAFCIFFKTILDSNEKFLTWSAYFFYPPGITEINFPV